MGRWRAVSFRAVCIVIVSGWGCAFAEPKLVSEPRTRDFGARLNYRDAEFLFTLSNGGTSPLEVSIKKAGCGCTSQMLSGETVAPGASAEMLLTYKVKREETRSGLQSFSVELAANDPENASVVLTARVKLVDQVYAEPESIELRNGVDSMPLRVFCVDDGGMPEVLSVEPGLASVAVERVGVERRERDTVYEYRVKRVPASAGGGPFSIVIKTSSARVPLVEVPVNVSAAQVLDANPGRVLFGVVKAGSTVEKRVVLTVKDEAVKLGTCTSPAAAIAPALAQGAVAGEWRVTVTLTAPRVSAVETIRSEVVVRDEGGRWLYTLPVVATVAP
jgi:hypothetical protein